LLKEYRYFKSIFYEISVTADRYSRCFSLIIGRPCRCARNVLFSRKEKSATDNNARIPVGFDDETRSESVSPRREFN